MPANCFLVSDQKEDEVFIEKIAKANRMNYSHFSRLEDIRKQLITEPQSVVFWNVHSEIETIKKTANKPPIETVQTETSQVLREFLQPKRIFLLSDKEFSEIPALSDSLAFGHYWMRRFDRGTEVVLSRLVSACFLGNPFEFVHYVPAETPTKTITIKDSSQREPACKAIFNVLGKYGIPDRIGNLVSYAVDELLMNAIYDAPTDLKKNHYRVSAPRSQILVLEDREKVTLELALNDLYGVICVTDHFGSLKREAIQRFIKKDYTKVEYEATTRVGAGLGVYGVLQSGLSLFYAVQPGKETKAFLMFPVVKAYKDFRKAFRFFGFIYS